MNDQIIAPSTAVVAESRDDLAAHAEDLLIARYHAGIADRGFHWPASGSRSCML